MILLQYPWLRRCITIPAYLLITGLMLLSLPIWLPLSWLLGLFVSGARSAARCLLFIQTYLLCESIGIVASFFIWCLYLGRHSSKAYYDANYRLQHWWANTLKRGAEILFSLRFEVEGEDALDGAGALMLARHTSIGDTVVPVVFYAMPMNKRLRYVLKKELLFDPCLDIVGNRLPNFFIDRFSDEVSAELSQLQTLVAGMTDQDSVLIYPEGTRFSVKKRQRVLQVLQEQGSSVLPMAEQWTQLLPPRPSGTLALLEVNPGRDVLMCAHAGFEGSASFQSLFNGEWVGKAIGIRFWRVPHAELPANREQRKQWLYEQWQRMQEAVEQLVSRYH